MANFLQVQKAASQIKPAKVKSEFFKYIRSVENLFFDFNIDQIEDSQNAEGQLLKNRNRRFKGVYAESTKNFALIDGITTPKVPGTPYNFLWSGEFLKGFQMFIRNGDLSFFSTGTGSGEKADFFKGYDDLFGLTDENLNRVIESELLPFLVRYYQDKLAL